jgi:hypothetical protein
MFAYILFLYCSIAPTYADTSVFAPANPYSYWDTTPNYSYLMNTKLLPEDFNTKLLGGSKKIAEMRQQYDDQTRDYYLRQPYQSGDISSSMIGMGQLQGANQGIYSSAYNAVKDSESSQYINNLKQANNQGMISQPIVYTAAAAGALTGNTVEASANSFKVSSNVNVSNQNGWAKVDANYFGIKMNLTTNVTTTAQTASTRIESPIYGTIVANFNPYSPPDALSAQALGTELYTVAYSRPIPYTGLNLGMNYTGSTQIYSLTLSRQIWKELTGEIDDSLGNSQIGVSPSSSCKIGYSVHF